MATSAQDLYQGRDWLTHRRTVAQVFTTLDHLRDLCLQIMMMIEAKPSDEKTDKGRIDLFSHILALYDELTGELDMALADLVPPQQQAHPFWIGFELQQHLYALRQNTLHEQQSPVPSPLIFDAIVSLASHMRELLKQIDS